jgi:hypothetical protein
MIGATTLVSRVSAGALEDIYGETGRGGGGLGLRGPGWGGPGWDWAPQGGRSGRRKANEGGGRCAACMPRPASDLPPPPPPRPTRRPRTLPPRPRAPQAPAALTTPRPTPGRAARAASRPTCSPVPRWRGTTASRPTAQSGWRPACERLHVRIARPRAPEAATACEATPTAAAPVKSIVVKPFIPTCARPALPHTTHTARPSSVLPGARPHPCIAQPALPRPRL